MSDAVIFGGGTPHAGCLTGGRKPRYGVSGTRPSGSLATCLEQEPKPSRPNHRSVWHACRAGQLQTAKYLAGKGENINWVGWDKTRRSTVRRQSGNQDLVAGFGSGGETRLASFSWLAAT